MESNLSSEFIETLHLNSKKHLEEVHAQPLMPFKERDWKALAELFDIKDFDQVEADIDSKLHLIVPEPCWEEDPFNFLREYL